MIKATRNVRALKEIENADMLSDETRQVQLDVNGISNTHLNQDVRDQIMRLYVHHVTK